uniref:Uncharacterized protein n=1 Tax=Anas platyrhynchos TaxID=8839 RepID=A0A8B9T8W1_ANAPL
SASAHRELCQEQRELASNISPQQERSGVGTGCPGSWWSPRPWGCSGRGWTWCLGTGSGRGLSRLFSSFLRRPKSQVSEEDKDPDVPTEGGGDQKDAGLGASPDEEILVKAPIAAPEPELKTDPSLDLHSLSSAETQVTHPARCGMLPSVLVNLSF